MLKGISMSNLGRRDFLRWGSAGLAGAGMGALVLPASAQPTEGSGELGSYAAHVEPEAPAGEAAILDAPKNWQPTEDNILGPYHRRGAPYRAKITPPLEQGVVLLVRGRVWGHDTRKPLAHATLDIWQANAEGRYDNDDPDKPPAKDVFLNRARLVTDETGYYEYETIVPGAYQIGRRAWRPSHIHYLVRHAGYQELITQLYFKGDPHNATDQFIKESLIIQVGEAKTAAGTYKTGRFDIVLAKA